MSDSNKTRIELSAADPATRITLFDTDMARVAEGISKLQGDFAPGIYRARIVSGNAMENVMIDATDPATPFIQTLAPVAFSTSVPLDNTRTENAFQDPARAHSVQLPRKFGSGSALFLFVRAQHPNDTIEPRLLSVHDASGKEVVRMDQAGRIAGENHAAMHVELDPGTYRLRVDGEGAGRFEMFITLCAGWQTQVFKAMESFRVGKATVRSAALHSASVLMARMGRGFDPSRPDLRLTELAKLSLARSGRCIDWNAIRPMLTQEYDNPLLGLYAAHIILQEHSRRPEQRQLLGEIVEYLGSPGVIPGHPDLHALRIAMASKIARFGMHATTPPMMRASWDIIIEASRLRDEVVPAGSLAASVAPNIIENRPWLLFACPTSEAVSEPATARTTATSGMAKKQLQRLLRIDADQLVPYLEFASEQRSKLSNIQLSLLHNMMAASSSRHELQEGPRTQADENAQAEALFNSLPSPSGATAAAINDLSHKLGKKG